MKDLYRGDGGPLSSYDEGWNDGVEAAEKAIRLDHTRRKEKEMSDTPETDAAIVSAEYIRCVMDYYADWARKFERQRDAAVDALKAIGDLDWPGQLSVEEYANCVLREIEGE